MEFQGSSLEGNFAYIIVLSTVLFLVLRCSNKWLSGSKRSPPEPRGSWPVMGHLPLLGTSKPAHQTLANLADQYGPIFQIKLGVHRAVVVSSWEVAKECLTTHDKAFSNRPRTRAFELLGYNFAMFGVAPYGPYWREIRKLATIELLSNHRIDMLKHVRVSELREFVKQIYDQCARSRGNSLVDMKKWLKDLNLSSTLRLVVGMSLSEISDPEERDRYHKALRDFFELTGAFMVSDAFPVLRWLDVDGYDKIMKRVAKELDFFHQRWLDDHKRSRVSGEVKRERDFIDVMLEILDNVDAKPSSYDTDTIIKATSLAIILGGLDTISVTLTWTLSLLLNNPQALKKAQEELDSHVGKARNVNESDTERLVYLQAVLKEAMRLYPAAPLSVPREAISDAIVNGYDIRAGTQLFVHLYKIHRDTSVWSDDACEFHPERFLVDHKDVDVRGQSFQYIPFGSGRRVCPGISYALRSMTLTLASVLHSFELGSPSDEPVDMTEEPGLTCTKATPLELLVTPRLPHHLYQVVT